MHQNVKFNTLPNNGNSDNNENVIKYTEGFSHRRSPAHARELTAYNGGEQIRIKTLAEGHVELKMYCTRETFAMCADQSEKKLSRTDKHGSASK